MESLGERKWSRKFTCCIKCNTTKNKHVAKGLCTRCQSKELYWKYHKKEKHRSRKYYRKNRERFKEKYAAYAREYYKKNPDKLRDRFLRKKYNITLEDFNLMYKNQNGCCYICKQKKTLNVDHNHKTGKTRALLCMKCNTVLGWLESNMYESLLSYLKEFNIAY